MKPARIALCVGLLVGAEFAGAQLGSFSYSHAQDADAAVEKYSKLLDQIQDVKLATQQRQVMMTEQKDIMKNLKDQIKGVPATKGSVRRVVTDMVAEMEKIIESDLPFREDERLARLGKLQSLLADKSTSDVDLYRRALTLYDVEANYGYSISAYTGNHPKTPGRRLKACEEDTALAACNLSTEQSDHMKAGGTLDGIADTIKDGNYVHFGRLSFIYLDVDSREGFRWSTDIDDWEPLDAGDIISARRSVRIARGESAPSVVTAPIKVQAAQ